MDPISQTSIWMAAARAAETARPDRLFSDPYAQALTGAAGPKTSKPDLAPTEKVQDPTCYLSIRTRFFDDALQKAGTQLRLAQVVILGAGLDCRAFRLDWPEGVHLYELDLAEILAKKASVLQKLEAKANCHRHGVTADFQGLWSSALAVAGFDPTRPAAFLAEGLMMYLQPAVAIGLLEALSSLAAQASWLGADLISKEILTSPATKALMDRLARQGCPWQFGISDPVNVLHSYGWNATVTMPGEPGANFGRWPYPVPPMYTPGIPQMYLVTAVRE
jgi:methyltransferase (TIGR00027 family)